MSQRSATFVLAAALSLIAMVSPVAWANGNHGDKGQHAHQQVDYRSARIDAPARNDRPVRNADSSSRNDRQPLTNDYVARDNYPSAGYAPRNGDLQSSVRRVQRETGGQVLRAQPILRDGREVYRVKVLTPQGRIRVYEDESSFPLRAGHRDSPYQDQTPPPWRRHPR